MKTKTYVCLIFKMKKIYNKKLYLKLNKSYFYFNKEKSSAQVCACSAANVYFNSLNYKCIIFLHLQISQVCICIFY
jgi:hypothetical protein